MVAVVTVATKAADYLGHTQVSLTQDVYMNRKSVGHNVANALDRLDPARGPELMTD